MVLLASLVLSTAPVLVPGTQQGPEEALHTFVTAEALDGARVGVLVRDTADGRVICGHDANRGFMTASNMKLVSSATALLTLGPDFRYRTTLVATGPVVDGVLEGDLVLVGSGDPTFGGRTEQDAFDALRRMVARAVADHGLRAIRGDVLGDDDCHPDEVMGEGWAWNYQGDAYAAQVSGLCFAENIARVTVAPAGGDGGAPAVSIEPAVPGFFAIENLATTVAAGPRPTLSAFRLRATNRVRVRGSVPEGSGPWSTRISVEDPTRFAARALHHVLVEAGIEVSGQALDRDDRPARPERYGDERILASHESAPLADILITLNKVSQNLYAEQVIRTASRVALGDASMGSASAHAKATLAGIGVDPEGMRIADGSGLTRLDLVQPEHFVDLLAGMWDHAHRAAFVATLPVAGVDGTIGKRFADTPATGRVLAKTGTISAVAALSGYVLRKDPEAAPLCFSILINNFTCRSSDARDAMDRFVIALVESLDR
ncbi:MAG: D-alanyl-D-alanine carboxypeptidase/D-alanyl-D-alanine-endopeptidase [Planctomycetota bacterium]|nr:D-alanyl-D-alanine carboxypeptidase/D-alanyl-D-alanine-endopeptidase [Planctomycetota bacterium]